MWKVSYIGSRRVIRHNGARPRTGPYGTRPYEFFRGVPVEVDGEDLAMFAQMAATNPDTWQVERICEVCKKNFPNEEWYLDHRCPANGGLTPRDKAFLHCLRP
jgi:hypothetical protein